ncbi:hypothetical protein N566_21170 [Streptomycetaceae bacterium MP113-05]|nr:hypothetical protein N566_21170 [Streptomycetaceae bacterium MP113-05]
MILPFTHDGRSGTVTVSLEQHDDPATVGKGPEAYGFPACTATVEHPARGYRAMFGWVQLVRSTDNTTGGAGFDLDPFCLFEDAPSPYAFFGNEPTLFDAPSRDTRAPLTWLAHSFLAWTPMDEEVRRVLPLAAFSWGFGIDPNGHILLQPPQALAPSDWNGHLHLLRASHPAWTFDPWATGSA